MINPDWRSSLKDHYGFCGDVWAEYEKDVDII